MKRIGILTSGGDCQGLNAAIRGVAKALYEEFGDNVEIYGINDGYRGLIEGNYKRMKPENFSGILTLGGTILGTSRQPFKLMRVIDENSVDKVKNMKDNYKKMKLDCLVVLGGNGTHKTANLLSEEGLNVVSLPKTIDNDVGWLTLYAGIAGGADVILLPEIPYDIDSIVKTIRQRNESGKRFSILAVAEGAMSKEEAKLSKKEFKAARASMTYPSISYRLAKEIGDKTGQEIRVTVPGHFQRGGSPCPYDRVLSTRFGAAAAKLIVQKQYGNMVALQNGKIVPVPLSEVAGKLKTVPKDCDVIQTGRDIGICFGD